MSINLITPPFEVAFSRNLLTARFSAPNADGKINYTILFKLYLENETHTGFDLIYKTNLQLLPNSGFQTEAMIGDKLNTVLSKQIRDLFPEQPNNNSIECKTSCRKYYFTYAESYGSPVVVQAETQSGDYVILHGGLSTIAQNKSVINLIAPSPLNAQSDRFLKQGNAQCYTRTNQPQYLYFFNTRVTTIGAKLQTKLYFDDDTDVTIDLYTLNLTSKRKYAFDVRADKVYTDAKLLVKYEVYLTDSNDVPISETRTYHVDYSLRKFIRYFLYWSSFGSLDSRVCYGKGEAEFELFNKKANRLPNIGEDIRAGQSITYGSKILRSFKISTGWMTRDQLVLNADFFLSNFKYRYSNGQMLPIEITPGKMPEAKDGDNLMAQSFEYRYHYEDHSYTEGDAEDPGAGNGSFFFNSDPLALPYGFDETDPTVPSWVKAITEADIFRWNSFLTTGPRFPRTLFKTSVTAYIAPELNSTALNPPGWTVTQPPNSGGGELITIQGDFVIALGTDYLTTNINNKWIWSIREEFYPDGTFKKWSNPIRITPIDGTNPDFLETRFKKNGSPTEAPSLVRTETEPVDWLLDVPVLDTLDFLWKTFARKSVDGELIEQWSLPILVTAQKGPTGPPGAGGYSVTLSADNIVVKAALDGTVTEEELMLARTLVTALRGTTELTAREVGTPTTGQYSIFVQSITGGTAGFINFRSGIILNTMTEDVAYVNINVNVENVVSFNKVFKVTKSKNGATGSPGQTSYIHIRYSNDSGVTFTPEAGTTTGSYLGQLVSFNPVASLIPAAYAWSKIKGESSPLPYGGDIYDSNKYYTGSATRVAVVRYVVSGEELAYVARVDAGDFKNKVPTDTAYWNPFTENEKLLATQLLFTQMALVKNLMVENLNTNVAPYKRFEISQSENNISHFAEGNAKIGEWDDDSALADDFYYIDIEANISNTLFFGTNRTANYSSYNAGSFNSKKGIEDNFANGFPRGYTAIKFFVSGSTYRYLFRDTTAGLRIGNPDDDYGLFGQTTIGRHLVSADSIVSKGAFATGVKTITGDYVIDTISGLSNGRDHTIFYRGSSNILVKLPLPVETGYTLPEASLMKNLNLGREIEIMNKGTGTITAYVAKIGYLIRNAGSGDTTHGIASNTTARFKLIATDDNPLGVSNYYWVLK